MGFYKNTIIEYGEKIENKSTLGNITHRILSTQITHYFTRPLTQMGRTGGGGGPGCQDLNRDPVFYEG